MLYIYLFLNFLINFPLHFLQVKSLWATKRSSDRETNGDHIFLLTYAEDKRKGINPYKYMMYIYVILTLYPSVKLCTFPTVVTGIQLKIQDKKLS